MTWRALRLVVDRGAIQSVSDRLFALGAQGVQEDFLPGEAPPPRQPWDTGPPPPRPRRQVLLAWFEDPDEAAIGQALGPHEPPPAWEDVPDQDWATSWQQGFEPIEVSPTLTVAPPWNAPPGALIVEPGQGFGTGHHPSTVGALTLMEPILTDLNTCLDVGCGSGVLALLAARQGLATTGIDVEEGAVTDAASNAQLNGLNADFSTTPLADIQGRFDLVLGNLHAELLVSLAPDLLERTRRVFICAGILADREQAVRAVFDPHLDLDARLCDGEWVALRYRTTP